MTPDPGTVATAIIASTLGGAAGSFVKEIISRGDGWLMSLVSEASPAVRAKSLQNMQNFMRRLSERVERLEAELPADESHVFAESLDDPECYLLTKKALLTASVTENDDRHEVLCELIAQRLGANQDDLITLTGQAACDVVGALSSKHIKLLALVVALQVIRPRQLPEISTVEEYEKFLLAWWNDQMTRICPPELLTVKPMDISHLVGLNCALYVPVMGQSNELISILGLGINKPNLAFRTTLLDKFKAFEWWPVVHHIVSLGVGVMSLTGIGILIGIIYHDSIKQVRTPLNW